MDKFRETMEALSKMPQEEKGKTLDKLRSMCTCPNCPTYNNCAKKADEKMFCYFGKSFMCISYEKGCICPTCPVTPEVGLHYTNFCTRGDEKAQRYEHTVWGTSMLKEKK